MMATRPLPPGRGDAVNRDEYPSPGESRAPARRISARSPQQPHEMARRWGRRRRVLRYRCNGEWRGRTRRSGGHDRPRSARGGRHPRTPRLQHKFSVAPPPSIPVRREWVTPGLQGAGQRWIPSATRWRGLGRRRTTEPGTLNGVADWQIGWLLLGAAVGALGAFGLWQRTRYRRFVTRVWPRARWRRQYQCSYDLSCGFAILWGGYVIVLSMLGRV
jgi:hypothetical protein